MSSLFLFSVTYCEDLNILHGDVNQSEPIRVGESVHVTCHHGYLLSEGDENVLKCLEGGKYNHNIPTCIGKKIILNFCLYSIYICTFKILFL